MLRARASQRGQVLPFVAVCLAILMGFAGLAVDLGYIQSQQRLQQSAADAAAIAGARALIYNDLCPDTTAAQAAATSASANGGFTNGAGSVTVTALTPTGGPFSGNACAVQVNVSSPHPVWFAKIFGFNGTMTTTATAIVAASGNGCVYLLDPAASTNFNGSSADSPGCSLLMNGTANFNGANIDALGIGYAGAAPNENGATFAEATPAPMLPVADPCLSISGCNVLAHNPPSATACTSPNDNGRTVTLTPGCYDAANFNGANVTLSPGLYVLNGTTTFNGATVSGTGVTLYVTSNGTAPNFNGDNLNISACTTSCSGGATSGVLYYQVPGNTSAPNFNGATNNVSGLFYAPSASANFNGSGGGYKVLVFASVNFNGSSLNETAPAAGQSLVKVVVLGL
jgi:hypothetical protein